MSAHDKFSPGSYDLSEAALKALYRDRDEDGSDDVAKLIAEADALIAGGQRDLAEPKISAASPTPVGLTPVATIRGKMETADPRASANPRRLRKIAVAVIALFGATMLAFGWTSYRPIRAPLAVDVAKPPAIAGVLRAADLASGYKIGPGETYAVDLPSGSVRIEVFSGQIALLSKNGDSLRPCSNQPFTIGAERGAPNSTDRLIFVCGTEPSLLQAVIPQPPLPSPAPLAPISPSTVRGGD